MQISLKQARRVEREIGAELDINVAHGLGGAAAISIHESFIDKLATIQKAALDGADKEEALLKIRFAIRKLIETENEVGGLNTLMNKEALLRSRAKALTARMTSELTQDEYKIAAARHAAAVNSGGVQSHYGLTDTVRMDNTMFTSTLDVLREKSKTVQREMLNTVDKLTALNSSRMISLSDEDVVTLEKYNIIVSE